MPAAPDLPAAVFFDAYGTLISWKPARPPAQVVAEGLWAAGVDAPFERVEAAVRAEMAFYRERQALVRTAAELAALRRDAATLVRDELGGRQACSLPLDDIAALLVKAFATWAYPEARTVIERLRARGLRTGVLSNFSYLLPLLLAEVGLAEHLDPIVFSAAEGVSKPDAAIFAAAARAVGADPAQCVLIGDDLGNDVAGARGVGMPVIWLNRVGQPIPAGVHAATDLIQAADTILSAEWRSLSLA